MGKRIRRLALLVAALLCATTAGAQSAGDVNCDGVVDDTDTALFPGALFDRDNDPCGGADVGGDGGVSAADCVALVQMLAVPTPTPIGPPVTYFGLAGANGSILRSIGDSGGVPVFFRNSGSGFTIVVEGRTGAGGVKPGERVFNPLADDPARRPSIELESRNPLGEGSPIVCDGGVPGVAGFDFGPGQEITDLLNDMACHASVSTARHSGCTIDAFGSPGFADSASELQFCIAVSSPLALPVGDTLLAVRLTDLAGNPGSLRRLIVRVGTGPYPATFTPTRSPTRTPAVVATRTRTRTPTVSPLPTGTASRTATRTRTATPTVTATPTLPSPVSPSPTPGGSPTLTPTRSTLATPPSPTNTRTATPSASATPTRTRSGTPTRTLSPVPTETPTVEPASGPRITFMGLANAADALVPKAGDTADGAPIYVRSSGRSLSLVIEAAPGANNLPVGCLAALGAAHPSCATYAGESPLADLQVVVSRALGNGSADVCDASGGVPAVDPPDFDSGPEVVDAVNDLSCRFVDGSGAPVGRGSVESCVQFDFEDSRFVKEGSTIQFCAQVTRALEFPAGETRVSARLRDVAGNLGPVGSMVVRVGP